MKRQRRIYENVALVAVRQTRQLVLFWARRCRKSTTLGSIAFDEMSREAGRTAIAASASLLLGKELVGMTLSATEQAAIVTREAAAVRTVFEDQTEASGLSLKVANADTGKILNGLTEDDFAEIYKSSSLEMRLYFSKTTYSRLKVIAPNPATARGWGGTVLRDEAGYTPVNLENDLRVATKPIMDTDPSFKLIYASNLCPNDRHPFFEMTMPAPDTNFAPDPQGHFYRGQNGILVHRVDLADSFAAGNVLYDDRGQPLSYEQFRARPENKLGWNISYGLTHEAGGTAAIDLVALLTAQRRGAGKCVFAFIENDAEFERALLGLQSVVEDGPVGIGFDVASTTGDTSNPSSVTVTEQIGAERFARLVVLWKEKKAQVVRERLSRILQVVRQRQAGGPARRLCIDASNERLFAEETGDFLRGRIPVTLVLAGSTVDPTPAGYEEKTNYKTYLGDCYAAAVNENRYALPPDDYLKTDHRLVVKDQGRYVCVPEPDGKHGDSFDSGKLAEHALGISGGPTVLQNVRVPGRMRLYEQRGCLV